MDSSARRKSAFRSHLVTRMKSSTSRPSPISRVSAGSGVSVAAGVRERAADADRIRAPRHATALIEDMETWAVAQACRATDTPLTVVRARSAMSPAIANTCAGRRRRRSRTFAHAFPRLMSALSG